MGKQNSYSLALQICVLAMMIIIVGSHLYERVIPATKFFWYEKNIPVRSDFGSDPIYTVSHFEVYELSTLKYDNILHCDYGNGFEYVSLWQATRPNVKPGKYAKRWRYNGERPDRYGRCYIEITITRLMSYTAPKNQTIKGESFWAGP